MYAIRNGYAPWALSYYLGIGISQALHVYLPACITISLGLITAWIVAVGIVATLLCDTFAV